MLLINQYHTAIFRHFAKLHFFFLFERFFKVFSFFCLNFVGNSKCRRDEKDIIDDLHDDGIVVLCHVT